MAGEAALDVAFATVLDRTWKTVLLAAFAVSFTGLVFTRLLPLANSNDYLTLRWRAWTGPSRTGIPSSLTRYLGDQEDWRSLLAAQPRLEKHPVEAFARVTSLFSRNIAVDPTEILKARLKLDEAADTIWIPRSEEKAGVYATGETNGPLSLLWGQHLGFIPRCSRGIIAVPPSLFDFRPKLKNGLDGRSLCLALGILSRNKGLDPHRLVCNLNDAERLRAFEENSALWPRPAKTLRSFYRAEMYRYFSGLGNSYVSAATELALLLADSQTATVVDWLASQLEHQDLLLNNRLAALGASAGDLARLYRGQYAAMLVSLSIHRQGVVIRPEITVFKAMCALDQVRESPQWLSENWVVEREAVEREILGDRGLQLVQAVV